ISRLFQSSGERLREDRTSSGERFRRARVFLRVQFCHVCRIRLRARPPIFYLDGNRNVGDDPLVAFCAGVSAACFLSLVFVFRIAQCFYTVEPFNRSISIAVTQADPASAKPRDPRVFWKETFARYEGKAEKEEGDEKKKESLREQEEEKTTPPKKLDGIGDAAYWTANRMGGALYVLKDDVFIRISVGGPDSEDSKINRCKALAGKAL